MRSQAGGLDAGSDKDDKDEFVTGKEAGNVGEAIQGAGEQYHVGGYSIGHGQGCKMRGKVWGQGLND